MQDREGRGRTAGYGDEGVTVDRGAVEDLLEENSFY